MASKTFGLLIRSCVLILLAGGSLACTRSLMESLPTPTSAVSQSGVPLEGFTTPTPTGQAVLATADSASEPASSSSAAATPAKTLAPSSSAGGTPVAYERRLAVFNLAPGEVLNVRSSPSVNAEIIATLQADTRQIEATGKTENADNFHWLEINLPDGQGGPGTGWVSAAFVVEEVPTAAFCADARVGQLLDELVTAIRSQNGTLLSQITSPEHGLRLVLDPAGSDVVALNDAGEIAGLFRSSFEYIWAKDQIGSFQTVILPELNTVFGVSSTRFCNSLLPDQGIAAGEQADWPFDYASLNFVAMYVPGAPDLGKEWRTWAVGVDYINDQPFISLLIQYR